METSRSKALKTLAGAMPVANQDVAQGLQQARLMQMQAGVAAAPTGPATAPVAKQEVQGAGAASVQSGAGIAAKTAEASQQAVQQVAQTAQVAQAATDTRDLSGAKQTAETAARNNETELGAMGRDMKQRLFDNRIKFEKDKSGQNVLNEYQMADWAASKAKSTEEYKGWAQKAQQAHDRKLQILEASTRKIEAELQNIYQKREVDRDQNRFRDLKAAKAALEKKIAQEKADAANKQAAWQTGGMIVGAVIGGVVTGGNPAGVAVGAQGGQAVGSYVGAQQSK